MYYIKPIVRTGRTKGTSAGAGEVYTDAKTANVRINQLKERGYDCEAYELVRVETTTKVIEVETLAIKEK